MIQYLYELVFYEITWQRHNCLYERFLQNWTFFIRQNALKDFSDDIVVETDIYVALETEEYPCDLHFYLEDQIRWNGEDIMSGNVQYTLNP